MKLPDFFQTADLPAVAKWAMDKLTYYKQENLIAEGVEATCDWWVFEGKFPRKAKEIFAQFDSPETGEQFLAVVRNFGGEYRGQKPTVHISFTRYASVTGCPLPA